MIRQEKNSNFKEYLEYCGITNDRTRLLEEGFKPKAADLLHNCFNKLQLSYDDFDETTHFTMKKCPLTNLVYMLNLLEKHSLKYVFSTHAYFASLLKLIQPRQFTEQELLLEYEGPNNDRIKAILERTGYKFEVFHDLRKYGPPPYWESVEPDIGCQVYCGNIPNRCYEYDLIPMFEEVGRIYELRLLMNPLTGHSKGTSFITFWSKEEALRAVAKFNGLQLSRGKNLRVRICFNDSKLYLANIPTALTGQDISHALSQVTAGLTNVITYNTLKSKTSKGYCFVEYETKEAAIMAKIQLHSFGEYLWGCPLVIEWADESRKKKAEIISKVTNLFVKNLTTEFSETFLWATFLPYGPISSINKIRNYAFVHFRNRKHALMAKNELNGKKLHGSIISIRFARPRSFEDNSEMELVNRSPIMLRRCNNSHGSGNGGTLESPHSSPL